VTISVLKVDFESNTTMSALNVLFRYVRTTLCKKTYQTYPEITFFIHKNLVLRKQLSICREIVLTEIRTHRIYLYGVRT
jgi:hypothetical protein